MSFSLGKHETTKTKLVGVYIIKHASWEVAYCMHIAVWLGRKLYILVKTVHILHIKHRSVVKHMVIPLMKGNMCSCNSASIRYLTVQAKQ